MDATTTAEIDGRERPLCDLHGAMAAQGRRVEIHDDARPEPDGVDHPAVGSVEPVDGVDGPALSRLLDAFPVDHGPESEPLVRDDGYRTDADALAAAVADILGAVPPEPHPETGRIAEPDAEARPTSAPSSPSTAGPWTAGQVRRFADIFIAPAIRRAGAEPPEPDTLAWWAEAAATWLNHVAGSVDPSNPHAAFFGATAIVFGPAMIQAMRARRLAPTHATAQDTHERRRSEPSDIYDQMYVEDAG